MKKILYLSFYDSDMPNLGNEYQVDYLNILAFYKTTFLPYKDIDQYDLIILGGGIPGIPRASDLSLHIPELYNLIKSIPDKKVLGICYGMQFLYHLYYNKPVQQLPIRHRKIDTIKLNQKYTLGQKIPFIQVKFNHKYYCQDITQGIISKYYLSKYNINLPVMVKFNKNHYGCQFHFTKKENLINFIDIFIDM